MEAVYVSLCFYAIVMILAEISRRLIDSQTSPGSLSRRFAYELIGTAQMCTCVYENSQIVKHYGLFCFFIVVTVLLTIGSIVNRGAFVSPLASIEAFYFSRIRAKEFGALLLAELIGGYMAFRWAKLIWSLGMSYDHAVFYENFNCKLRFKVPYLLVILFEVIGCFLVRYIVGSAPASTKRYVSAITVAGFLTFAIAFIGVPDLNPIVAFSRRQGCTGLSINWFLITYWLCPIIGALSAASYESGHLPLASKKIN